MGGSRANAVIPLGMVYTDPDGKIVFANRHFLDMLALDPARSPIGRPLWETLHLDAEIAAPLLLPRERGSSQRLIVTYSRADGSAVLYLCASQPAFDQTGKFIGMNIGLDVVGALTGFEDVPVQAVSGYQLPGLQPAPTPQPDDSDLNGAYLDAVLNALQAMLARLAGPVSRETLVGMLDRTAFEQGWPISAYGGQLIFERRDIPAAACTRLLAEAFDYAIAVVGRRVIIYEIEVLYATLDESLIDHALQAGLSVPVIKHLAT